MLHVDRLTFKPLCPFQRSYLNNESAKEHVSLFPLIIFPFSLLDHAFSCEALLIAHSDYELTCELIIPLLRGSIIIRYKPH